MLVISSVLRGEADVAWTGFVRLVVEAHILRENHSRGASWLQEGDWGEVLVVGFLGRIRKQLHHLSCRVTTLLDCCALQFPVSANPGKLGQVGHLLTVDIVK